MTNKYRNKIQSYFKDEDDSTIIINSLERIYHLEMREIICTFLVESGFLQRILDFFKDSYPILLNEVRANKFHIAGYNYFEDCFGGGRFPH